MGQRHSSLKHSVSYEFLFLHKKYRTCFVFLFPWNSPSSSSTAIAWAGFLFHLWRSLPPLSQAETFEEDPQLIIFFLFQFVSLYHKVSGYSGFPLFSKTNISRFQFDQESGRRSTRRTAMCMCYL